MPFYDFHCDECQATFTVRASLKEKEAGLKPECPQCHSQETEQVITAPFIRRGKEADFVSPACGPNAGPGCC